MKMVAQILRSKPDPTVHAIVPTASMFDALQLMAEKNIGALLIMEGETIVGMVSERDYARKIALLGRSSVGADLGDQDGSDQPVDAGDLHQQGMLFAIWLQLHGKTFIE